MIATGGAESNRPGSLFVSTEFPRMGFSGSPVFEKDPAWQLVNSDNPVLKARFCAAGF